MMKRNGTVMDVLKKVETNCRDLSVTTEDGFHVILELTPEERKELLVMWKEKQQKKAV